MADSTTHWERVPPHNLEAEQSLLGSMFLSSEAVETCLNLVKTEDFYRAAHGVVFDAVAHLYNKGEPVDVITVADRIESTSKLDMVGGRGYLLDLTNTVPTAANAQYYAEIVQRMSMLRQLIGAATQISALAYGAPDDLKETVEEAEKLVFDVTNKRVSSEFQRLEDLLKSNWDAIAELAEKQEHLSGVPTGFSDLDSILGGLHKGDLVVLAARPSVGKTALALNMAVNAAKEGVRVALFSLEMSADQLVQRVLCSEARIRTQGLRTGTIGDGDWDKMMRAMGRLAKCDLWVDDTPAVSIVELRAKARRQLRDSHKGLIIVDYLQLMQPQGRRSENRQVEIAEISRGLKILAKELGVPIVALSQLSRAVEQRTDKRPILSDLRESGAIEQDADVVLFIHRDTRPTTDGLEEDKAGAYPPKGEAEIIIAKHRNGPTGMAKVVYQADFTRFDTMHRHGNL